MLTRCYNKNHKFFKDYGGRGITVCEEWRQSYEEFRDYVKTLPNYPANAEIPGSELDMTIERIKNDQGYKPGNIKWATRREQANNRRTTYLITVNGMQLSLADAVRQYTKVPYHVVLGRLRLGWSKKDAFLKSVKE